MPRSANAHRLTLLYHSIRESDVTIESSELGQF